MDGAGADKRALLDVLAQWVGRPVVPAPVSTAPVDFEQYPPVALGLVRSKQRPEYLLFYLQRSSYQIGKSALALRSQPRLEAFAQGGIGRPNPFNFFETGFQPYVLPGLRAAWTPFDWGQRRREAQVFDLQMLNVEAQQQSFEQRLDATTVKDRADIVKMRDAVIRDNAIIQLQADIVRRAEAQVKNGVMTMTDYLTQVDLLTQARLLRSTHLVQAAQAWEMLVAKTKEKE